MLNLVTFVVIQLAMGITVLIARYLGEKRPEQIGSVIGGSAIVFAIISADFICDHGWICSTDLSAYAGTGEAVDLTNQLCKVCGGGILFIVAYNLLGGYFPWTG